MSTPSLKLKSIPLPASKHTIACDITTGVPHQNNFVADCLTLYTLSPTQAFVLLRNLLLIIMSGQTPP